MRTRLIRIGIIMLMADAVYGCAVSDGTAAAWGKICRAAVECSGTVRTCSAEAQEAEGMPEIDRSQDRLRVRIVDDEEYARFIGSLKQYTDCRRLSIDLEGTDTTVCSDEIVAVLDLEYLYIGNGGSVAYRNVPTLTYPVDELKLDHVRSIEKSLTEAVLSGSLHIRDTFTIELDENYAGADALTAAALLEKADCPNVILFWDGKTGSLCDAAEDMEDLAEWEHIQAVQKTTAGSLQCVYRLDEDGRRYISYEFYETLEGGGHQLADAFISVRDICTEEKAAFDIIEFPADRLGKYTGPDKGRLQRLSASEDLNFDGRKDLVFDGINEGSMPSGNYTVFLWNEEEQRYIWAEDAPKWYYRIDRDRQRLLGRSRLSASDEDYQIYEYRNGAFHEKHLEIRTKASDYQGLHWDVTGQYYRDGTLEARLEMIYGEDGARRFFYEQIGGRGREELQIAGDLTYEDVSRIVFSEFDFYWH